jgi:hypothetical protein
MKEERENHTWSKKNTSLNGLGLRTFNIIHPPWAIKWPNFGLQCYLNDTYLFFTHSIKPNFQFISHINI